MPKIKIAYLSLIFASLALEGVVPQIGDGDQAAEVAHVYAVRIGDLEQPLPQELRSAVRNLTISLHLSETETAVPGSALHGLSHQNLNGASGSRVNFVVHHVLEALVVGGAQEDLRLQFASRVTIVHDLVSSQLVAVVVQQRRNFLHVDGVVERSGVTNFTSVCRNL